MDKLRICIFTPMIFPVPAVKGGAVEGLVELLIRMNEKYKKMELTIVSIYDKEAQNVSEKYNNCNFVWINRENFWDKFWSKKIWIYLNKIGIKFHGNIIVSLPAVKKAWKYVENQKFHAYILEGGGDFYNFGYLHKRIPNEKFLVHFHGEVPGDKAIKKWFGRYVTVSNYIGRKLICNGEVDSKLLRILPNCFDADSMQTRIDKKSIREKYGLLQDDFVFVYWGRLIPEKGVLELLEAFEKVNGELKNSKLLIVGNANFGYSIKTRYDELLSNICNKGALQDCVKFTGFVNHDDMGSLLEACDVGIIPSIWDDPAPLTVFEGLSKGLPLIATRVGGIPEIIIDGENGYVLDWDIKYTESLTKKMIEVYRDNETRMLISNNAKKSVLEYTPDRYYKNFVDIIEEIKNCSTQGE